MTRKLFFVLLALTVVIETVSLQARLAIFGGMGWLTTIKFTGFWERLGFIAILSLFCAAFCGLWVLIFKGIGTKTHASPKRTAILCATLWIVLLAADLIFRHKVGALLGNAFNFFDFATGVGGIWRMLEQAFEWYGDVIAMAALTILAIAAISYGLFYLIFKKKEAPETRQSTRRLAWFTILALLFNIAFMSVLVPHFHRSNRILANETMFGAWLHFVIKQISDFDGDGYGAFDIPADLAPFDAERHPYAIDMPDDGIDQDLLLGDLKLRDIPNNVKSNINVQGMPNSISFAERRHVILVIMESVRHDMLDATVDGKKVMPNLQNFIKDKGALRIDGAFATRGFTQNSVTQTFWGSYFEPTQTLVDDFKSLGYHTAAFSGEDLKDEAFDESLGWNRSGDTVVDPRSIPENIYHHTTVPARVLMNKVEAFLANYDTAQPLFLYLFYQDPHFPYQQDNPNIFTDRPIKRSEITASTRPRLWRTYANQVHHLDKAAGRLIDALEKKNMLNDAIVIFISDHGESLFDDGYLLGHGIAIRDVMTHCVMAVYGARHDLPSILTHVDLRQWIYNDLNTPPGKRAKIKKRRHPILQFIGATTVPSAISFRYDDGRKTVFDFDSQTGNRFIPLASLPNEKQTQTMPQHGDTPINAHIDIKTSLVHGYERPAEIPTPLEDLEIQQLIKTWEYLQWQKRHAGK